MTLMAKAHAHVSMFKNVSSNDWRCYVKGLCHQNGFNIGPDVEETCDRAVKCLRMTSFQLD